mgnify:CR=1 FL=1
MTKEKFEELTPEQNQIIKEARDLGYAGYYPSFPDSQAQAINTLDRAIDFLKRRISEEEKKLNKNINVASK